MTGVIRIKILKTETLDMANKVAVTGVNVFFKKYLYILYRRILL